MSIFSSIKCPKCNKKKLCSVLPSSHWKEGDRIYCKACKTFFRIKIKSNDN